MSKDKATERADVKKSDDVVVPEEVQRISEMDRLALELVKAKEQEARAKHEASVMVAQNLLFQIYRKYNLLDTDGIKEDGTITHNAVPPQK